MCKITPGLSALLSDGLIRRNITQAQLASETKLSPGAVSNILKGNDLPSKEALTSLALALNLNEPECLILLQYENLRKQVSGKYDSFLEGLTSLFNFALQLRESQLANSDPLVIDIFVTWMHARADDKPCMFSIVEKFLEDASAREHPVKVRFCTVSPSSISLLAARALPRALAFAKEQPRETYAVSGGQEILRNVIRSNFSEASGTDKKIFGFCSAYEKSSVISVEHRYNFGWFNAPNVIIEGHLALYGFYPAIQSFCSTPAQIIGSDQPEYAVFMSDNKVVWDSSIEIESSEKVSRIGRKTYADEVKELFKNTFFFEDRVSKYIDSNLGRYLNEVLKDYANPYSVDNDEKLGTAT